MRNAVERVLGWRLRDMLRADPQRMAALRQVRALELPDGWIGAGFVRNLVWDRLHGRAAAIRTDIDVVWFDRGRADRDCDRALAARLSAMLPGLDWSVSNQARMHVHNGDAPYRSVADALRFWPETATAIAVRLAADDTLQMLAPFGLTDLFALRLRSTPAFAGLRRPLFEERVRDRNWLATWPRLRQVPAWPSASCLRQGDSGAGPGSAG